MDYRLSLPLSYNTFFDHFKVSFLISVEEMVWGSFLH